MASTTDFTAGKVIAVMDDVIVFNPRGTTYELHLKSPAGATAPPLNSPIEAIVRVTARKVWTVASGGNFITPIQGTPRIIQGRVRYLDNRQLVVSAGANVIVDLPAVDSAFEMPVGAIAVGKMVNVTAFPGASVEFVAAEATRR